MPTGVFTNDRPVALTTGDEVEVIARITVHNEEGVGTGGGGARVEIQSVQEERYREATLKIAWEDLFDTAMLLLRAFEEHFAHQIPPAAEESGKE
jgi:hypothetical protein